MPKRREVLPGKGSPKSSNDDEYGRQLIKDKARNAKGDQLHVIGVKPEGEEKGGGRAGVTTPWLKI